MIQYIPRNMHTVFALLCFVVVIHWLIFPYPPCLLHWHCGNLTIAPVPAKQPWWIWINTSCEFIMNDCITTTKQSTTKPCAFFLGYTVHMCVSTPNPPKLMDVNFILGHFYCSFEIIDDSAWKNKYISRKPAMHVRHGRVIRPTNYDMFNYISMNYCDLFRSIYLYYATDATKHQNADTHTQISHPDMNITHFCTYARLNPTNLGSLYILGSGGIDIMIRQQWKSFSALYTLRLEFAWVESCERRNGLKQLTTG